MEKEVSDKHNALRSISAYRKCRDGRTATYRGGPRDGTKTNLLVNSSGWPMPAVYCGREAEEQNIAPGFYLMSRRNCRLYYLNGIPHGTAYTYVWIEKTAPAVRKAA